VWKKAASLHFGILNIFTLLRQLILPASAVVMRVTASVYLPEFKFYSVQRLFHHRFVFNCFKRRLIRTALAKTAICEGLLIFTNVFGLNDFLGG
jgi:hypothetical protein